MNEKEKNIPTGEENIDTVSGDIDHNARAAQDADELQKILEEIREENAAPKDKKTSKKRAPMSKRTKKRLITVGIVSVAVLLLLAAILISVTIINNQPPEFSEVRGRFEALLLGSQEINEIIWGAGLPTYKRVEREIKTYDVAVKKGNGDPVTDKDGAPVTKTLRYYLYEDVTLGTIVSYEYQARVAEGKTTEVEVNGQMQTVPVYTIYDVENGGVLTEYKNGAARFAQKSQTPIEGKTLLLEKDGYYYYALPSYENPDLAYAEVYSGNEDSHYDYVRFDQAYKSVEELKSAIKAVYADAFMAPLYESLFTGMVGAVNDVHQAAYSDYIDGETDAVYLMKSNTDGSWKWRDPLPVVQFDPSTMQMIDGNAQKVTVTVDYRLAGSDTVKQMKVDFVLESGEWYLNTPTFG